MPPRNRLTICLASLVLAAGCATSSTSSTSSQRPAPAIDPAKVIDLSHTFGPDTIYWPTAEPFKLRRVAYGRTPKGYWYAANNLSMAEHGGTHMDAPVHFAEGKPASADVPLAHCIAPAVVIDVSAQCTRDRDYRLTAADVEAFEQQHGRIPRGAIFVVHTGWSQRWPDKKQYLGTDVPMDVANLHFPGYSKEATELLVNQRHVAALAIDTASIDYGQSEDFICHQILGAAERPAFENVANTHKLPATGATIIALPLKIEGGSGGPARVIALLP
jgi:kynurenine formamidase